MVRFLQTRPSLFFPILFIWIGFFSFRCSQRVDVQPKMSVAGYKASAQHLEDFESDLSDWQIEGLGEASIRDGKLEALVTPQSLGFVLWYKKELPENFMVEYKLDLLDTAGTHTAYICGDTDQEADFLNMLPKRSGEQSDYTRTDVRNYQVTVHVTNKEGLPLNRSRVRKNPNYYLLAHSDIDPCMERGLYVLNIVKIGNRIQHYVDGHLIHDVRDKGGFDQRIYRNGKVGLRFDSTNKNARTRIDDFRVFQLSPN